MDGLYNDIIDTFTAKKTWFTEAGLKPPSVIDEYKGQPEDPEYFEFTLPAIFIDYRIVPKKQGKIWVNGVELIFHCIPEVAPSASNISPRRTQGLEVTRWYTMVKMVIDTVKGDHYTTLARSGESPTHTQVFDYHIINNTTQLDQIDGNEYKKYTDGNIEEVAITGTVKKKYSL